MDSFRFMLLGLVELKGMKSWVFVCGVMLGLLLFMCSLVWLFFMCSLMLMSGLVGWFRCSVFSVLCSRLMRICCSMMVLFCIGIVVLGRCRFSCIVLCCRF